MDLKKLEEKVLTKLGSREYDPYLSDARECQRICKDIAKFCDEAVRYAGRLAANVSSENEKVRKDALRMLKEILTHSVRAARGG